MSSRADSISTVSRRPPRRHGQGSFGRARNPTSGVTLAEVLIGMTVLGTACLSALAGMLMSLRIADSNLLALSAASAARSVSEQLLAVDYVSLFNAEIPVDVPSHPAGSLIVDAWNMRTDDLHQTPGNPNDDLRMQIKPFITRIKESDGVDYAQVVISYEWLDSSFFVPRTRSDTLTMLVAPVPSF
jgi:hypothetical protein